jgi:hypothetical protein
MFAASKLDSNLLKFALSGRGTIMAAGAAAALLLLPPGPPPAEAQTAAYRAARAAESHAHAYLMRGLMNIFSLGMDELAAKIQQRGVAASVYNHAQADAVVAQITARFRAGDRGPVILIGHSLGADAVMEMAKALDRNNVPVALVIPFDGTASFTAPKNVASVVNLTQREYAYMKSGRGFHGAIENIDVSNDPNIGHITIDKSPRMQAIALSHVLRVAAGAARRHAPANTTARKRGGPGPGPAAAKHPEPEPPTLRGHLDGKPAGTGVL